MGRSPCSGTISKSAKGDIESYRQAQGLAGASLLAMDLGRFHRNCQFCALPLQRMPPSLSQPPAPTQFPWRLPMFLYRLLPLHWKDWLASASALQTLGLSSDHRHHMSRVSQLKHTRGASSSAQARAHHSLLSLTTLPYHKHTSEGPQASLV